MRFHLEFLNNHGIYGLHADVLTFFNNCVNINRFKQDQLFTPALKNVIDDSDELLPRFRAVFKELNRAGIDKQLVIDIIINNNETRNLLINAGFALQTLPLPQYSSVIRTVRSLYSFLWSSTIKTIACGDNYGDINDHYAKLDALNKPRIDRLCPFCGLEKLKNPKEKRNEYDHYLYKDLYPFSAINFANLVPMCDSCNKRPNKGTKNVILDEVTGMRRTAYYAYEAVENFNVDMVATNVFGVNSSWQAVSVCPNNNQSFNTWKTVFNIDFRYSNFVDSNYERWLKDFNAYFDNQTPQNLPQLRTRVGDYLDYRNRCAISEGDFLEKRFWTYFYGVSDADLNLFLAFLTQTNLYLNP